jgi:hypothetical protein
LQALGALVMTSADEYRIQAAALAAQARDEMHANVRKELLQLSKLYVRLAEQADKNSRLDVTLRAISTTPPAP